MNRDEYVLAVLASAKGNPFSPVQVQKLFFLLDRYATGLVGGPRFNFAPYHYGPFDQDVYLEIEGLAKKGMVDLIPNRTWMDYRLTSSGQVEGERQLKLFSTSMQDYIVKLSDFVRSLSFGDLVSAIYKAFPEMRERSVFQG